MFVCLFVCLLFVCFLTCLTSARYVHFFTRLISISDIKRKDWFEWSKAEGSISEESMPRFAFLCFWLIMFKRLICLFVWSVCLFVVVVVFCFALFCFVVVVVVNVCLIFVWLVSWLVDLLCSCLFVVIFSKSQRFVCPSVA